MLRACVHTEGQSLHVEGPGTVLKCFCTPRMLAPAKSRAAPLQMALVSSAWQKGMGTQAMQICLPTDLKRRKGKSPLTFSSALLPSIKARLSYFSLFSLTEF